MIAGVVGLSTRDLEWSGIMGVGPGYFPTGGAAVLFALGVCLCGGSMLKARSNVIDFTNGVRPAVYVTVSVLLFASMLNSAGLIITVIVVSLVASAASGVMSMRARGFLALVLAAFATLVFHVALSLPMPLWPNLF